MDWDLKGPLWDLAELDRVADLNHGSMLSGPGGGFSQRSAVGGLDCSVDLKLGGLGDSGSSFKWKDQPNASTATEPSSRPSKRQRGSGSAAQVASCLVDGCSADLSKCRDYHRRHKVCEDHSKTPVVVVGGQEQRFCQQCSRFHSIQEFDQVKRSCRKRLDCHNRRRRKTHPNSVNSGTKLSTYPQLFPTAITDPNWAGTIIPDDHARHTPGRVTDFVQRRHSSFLFNSSSSCNKEQRQFPFLQESDSSSLCSIATIGSLVGQSHVMTSTPPEILSSSNKMFSNGLTHVFHSDCALSLLSSSNQASSFGLRSTDRIRGVQPLVSSMQSDISQFSHSAAEAVFVSNIANGAVAHSHSIYPTGDRISQAFSQ